jgi:hypothetical protein
MVCDNILERAWFATTYCAIYVLRLTCNTVYQPWRRRRIYSYSVGTTISLSLACSLLQEGEADLASLLLCSLSALQPLLHSCHTLDAVGYGVVIGSGIVGCCV